MSREEAINWSMSGPVLRASGVDFDLRKQRPYSGYENFDFAVPLGKNGDIYDRYLVRVAEMRESRNIVEQALKKLPTGPYKVDDNKISLPNRNTLKSSMEALIHHFKLVSEGISVPKGETYVPVEGPRGEVGFVWADTSNTWNGKDSVMCDHYRLDINIEEEKNKLDKRSDYFMEEILADGVVKELWVSRKKPKRIMRATLKTKWFPVLATINE